ncbi:DUF5320 family protein [bacterium]|nr:DUF5320 family protein [bacterium]
MPNKDGTGPRGKGPQTGRGSKSSTSSRPGYGVSRNGGRARGTGLRRNTRNK